MHDPEFELIDRLLAGDEAAFEALVAGYRHRLLRLARVYVRTEAQAADVVQETWLAVLRGLPRFERRSSLQTWMFHILANRARTYAVREGRLVPMADLAAKDAGNAREDTWFDQSGRWLQPPAAWQPQDPEAGVLSAELRQALEAAIDALPPAQRAVLILRDVEGGTAEEACNILGLSETNQRVLLHRGRTRVRQAVATLLERGNADEH